jgi:hypothetical protein
MPACGECKQSGGEVVADAVAAAAAGVVAVVGGACRLVVRGTCHWLRDDQLEHGKRVLRWQLSLWALVAAAVSWWLGRWAAAVWVGLFAGSWAVDYGLGLELARRQARARQVEVDRRRQAHEAARARAGNREPRTRDLDAEAEAMVAAYKASEGDQ